MPLLALTLLLMNNRKDWTGPTFRNGRTANFVLALTLVFFAYAGATKVSQSISKIISPPTAPKRL